MSIALPDEQEPINQQQLLAVGVGGDNTPQHKMAIIIGSYILYVVVVLFSLTHQPAGQQAYQIIPQSDLISSRSMLFVGLNRRRPSPCVGLAWLKQLKKYSAMAYSLSIIYANCPKSATATLGLTSVGLWIWLFRACTI